MKNPKDMKPAADFLRRISAGEEVCIDGDQKSWDDGFACDHVWTFASGWKLVVFNDCDSWDYVDSIVTPDGDEYVYNDINCWQFGPNKEIDEAVDDDSVFCREWEPNETALRVLRLNKDPR